MRFCRLSARMADVYPGLRSNDIENANGGVDAVSMQEWHRTVQGHFGVSLVLKYIEVVKTVRVFIIRVLSSRSR